MRKALYILSTLDDVDIDWIARQGAVQRVEAGTTLITEGRDIEHLYFVLDGEFAVWVGGSTGAQVARLFSGEILGEISFVDTHPPSASVIAIRDGYVLALRRDQLAAKLETDDAFAARFYRAVAKFLADRLYVTVGRFGYGTHQQDANVDLIDDRTMEDVSLGSFRFDRLLKQLRGDYRIRSTAGIV